MVNIRYTAQKKVSHLAGFVSYKKKKIVLNYMILYNYLYDIFT